VRNHEWGDLHEVVIATATTLFTSVGLPVAYDGIVPHAHAPWSGMVAVIGLGGAKLRGTLVVSMPASFLRRSHPAGGTEDADLADWLSEQANLLLGRIKARLLGHEVIVELSTPVTLAASAFRSVRFGSTPLVHRFELDGESILVGFESVAEKGVELRMPAREDAVVLDAGEIMIF
jgi:CheY-specific phosphatase CheX